MTKEECAKIMAVKYILDYNTFKMNDKMRNDLLNIRKLYRNDGEFEGFFEKYCEDLRNDREMPRWARLIMAERYGINI